MNSHTVACASWCARHDNEIGQCHSSYWITPLSLEFPVEQYGETRPPQLLAAVDDGPDGPVIVVFPNIGGAGVTLTLTEAAQHAAHLTELVELARGVA